MAIVPVAPTYAEKLSLSKVQTGTVLAAAGAPVTLAFLAAETHDPPYRRGPLGGALRAARRDRVVVAGVAVILLVGTMGGAINLLVPLELRHNGFSSAGLGLVLSGSSA